MGATRREERAWRRRRRRRPARVEEKGTGRWEAEVTTLAAIRSATLFTAGVMERGGGDQGKKEVCMYVRQVGRGWWNSGESCSMDGAAWMVSQG